MCQSPDAKTKSQPSPRISPRQLRHAQVPGRRVRFFLGGARRFDAWGDKTQSKHEPLFSGVTPNQTKTGLVHMFTVGCVWGAACVLVRPAFGQSMVLLETLQLRAVFVAYEL